MTEMVPKIRLRNLHKRFGDKVVLDGIDLDVMPRTSMVVIGGSGSGKSVLLKPMGDPHALVELAAGCQWGRADE